MPRTFNAKAAKNRLLCLVCALGVLPQIVTPASAQDTPSPGAPRLAILIAEDRRAPTPRDLATIRSGTRSPDPETAIVAVRALGRLERPAVVPDILPSLKHPLPEVRAEAANALGQALAGPKRAENAAATIDVVDVVIGALIARLNVEAESSVRGAICENLGRVPSTSEQVQRVDNVLVTAAAHEGSIDGRLGIAGGLEALVRLHRRQQPPSEGAIGTLRSMVAVTPPNGQLPPDPSRDVRVRRLALEALAAAEALVVIDQATLDRAVSDPDPKVRRRAMRAAGDRATLETLTKGLTDSAA